MANDSNSGVDAADSGVTSVSFFARHERFCVGSGALIGFLAFWEAVVYADWVSAVFVSSPSRVVVTAWRLFGEEEIWRDLGISGTEFLIGYLMATCVAIPLGLALGWYKRLYFALSPFVHTLNVVPRITLLPVIIIWFGIGVWSKVAVVFLGAVIPILISTMSGVRTNEERFLNVARSFGATESKIFTSVVLPGTVPFIFTGLKYAAGRALLGVIVAELYAATAGIGYFISAAGNALQTDQVLVGVLIVTFVGLVTVEALNRIERRFEVWRPKVGA